VQDDKTQLTFPQICIIDDFLEFMDKCLSSLKLPSINFTEQRLNVIKQFLPEAIIKEFETFKQENFYQEKEEFLKKEPGLADISLPSVDLSEQSRSRSRSSQLSSNRSNSNPSDNNVSGISAKSSPYSDDGDSSDDFLINSDDYPKISARYVNKEGPSSDSETDPITKEDHNTKSSFSETDSSSRNVKEDIPKSNSNPLQIRRTSSIGAVNRFAVQNPALHPTNIVRLVESRSSESRLKYKGGVTNKSNEEINPLDDKTKENSLRRRSINDRSSLTKIRRDKELQAAVPEMKQQKSSRKEKKIEKPILITPEQINSQSFE